MTDFWMFESPIGPLALGAEEGVLVRMYLPNQPTPRIMPHKSPLMEECEGQLMEYFRGERVEFDLPLAPQGTDFQKRVWEAVSRVPWGRTQSYGYIAQEVGSPRGFRAVGMACGRNPLPILIPCHRVVGSRGELTGYAGGPEMKRWLLEHEKKYSNT